MDNDTKTNGNGKLAALQKRMDAAREKMAAEKERLREQQRRETEKLYRLVGEECCKSANDADFAAPLRRVLNKVTDANARRFLAGKGMLPIYDAQNG